MNNLLESAAEFLGSAGGPRRTSPVLRAFVALAMGVAGICFMVFAGILVAQMNSVAILLALLLFCLSALCFWLVWRSMRR